MKSFYKKGFGDVELNLLEVMDNMEIIDGHEHTHPEEARLEKNVDVFTLFSHYTHRDLSRAGMSETTYKSLFDTNLLIEKRWKEFMPYWENIRHTSYSRAALLAAKKFYGAEDINQDTYRSISENMKKNNKPGIYKKVFKDACKIKTCLCQCGRTDVDPDFFTPVMPLRGGFGEAVIDKVTGKTIFLAPTTLGLKENNKIKTLDDYLAHIQNYIDIVKKDGAVGLKMISFPYTETTKEDATKEFVKIKEGKHIEEVLFDSYTIDKAIEYASKQGLTIAVHTGYWRDFRYLHPLHMIPLLLKYPNTKFDIYHLGYPWVRETIMLAKGFSNVWLNLCWTYAISQKCTTEAIDEIIDAVPTNKIIGFGADYNTPVEKIFGHLVMAKESIASILGKRIREGTMREKHAITIIKKWFWENPKELYNLQF